MLGADSPPVICLASFFNIIRLFHLIVFFFRLVACSLRLPRLKLEECVRLRLRDQPGVLQGPEEALALLNVSATQVALIVDEIV